MNSIELTQTIKTSTLYTILAESKLVKVNRVRNLMIFNGMYYSEVPGNATDEEMAIRDLFTEQSQKYLTKNIIKETVHTIKTVRLNHIKGCCSNTGRLVFENGIFDIQSSKLVTDFNLEDTYWARINASYLEHPCIDDAPIFKHFLITSLDYGSEEGNKKTELLLQIIGYCISDFTTAKKAFFFVGNPDSGKSQILEFLRNLLPENETTQIPFSDLGDRFAAVELRNSRINLSSEIEEKQFPRADYIKRLTSNDTATVSVKHKGAVTIESRTRFISASNSMPLPKHADGTNSIVNRMCFLLFENTIPKDKQDKNLVDKLFTERDVICSLAVQALKELVSTNYSFVIPASSHAYSEQYMINVNPTPMFFDECCIEDNHSFIKPKELFDRYLEFCKHNDIRNIISRSAFMNAFESRFHVIKCRCRRHGDKNPTNYYQGVTLI